MKKKTIKFKLGQARMSKSVTRNSVSRATVLQTYLQLDGKTFATIQFKRKEKVVYNYKKVYQHVIRSALEEVFFKLTTYINLVRAGLPAQFDILTKEV